jgi:hypothetical protein
MPNNIKMKRTAVKIEFVDGYDILMKNKSGFLGRDV